MLNLLSIHRCHIWLESMREDSLLCITNDLRGSYKRNIFYELYPDLELEAKAFALNKMSQKESTFTIKELADFVNERFKQLYQNSNVERNEENELIRSEESIRCDLLRWGAKYDSNKKRPYFEGHERDDVVQSRNSFCSYFIENKNLYYQIERKENIYNWIKPTLSSEIRLKPRILIAHDESTYRSGEIPVKRWIYEDLAPFFNKGRGRSIMVSAFIVLHDEVDVFKLDQDEWNDAIKEFPELNETDEILEYYEFSANAYIEPKKDNYFCNSTIIKQFTRLFKLMRYKKKFFNHQVEIIVDNARTHSAKDYDVNLLSKSPNTNCPYEKIEWQENDQIKTIKCFDDDNISKGLLQIAKEMKIIEQNTNRISLNELREKVNKHPAFSSITKLEKQASFFNVKIIWCPKFHCELNPIEGLWCYSKNYVRKNNDQNYNNLNKLIITSINRYQEKNLNIKLWNRFWQCLLMYKSGLSYRDVLNELFSSKATSKPTSHTKISNTNLISPN